MLKTIEVGVGTKVECLILYNIYGCPNYSAITSRVTRATYF